MELFGKYTLGNQSICGLNVESLGSRVSITVSVGSENSAHPGVAAITDSKIGATSRNDSTDRLNMEWRAKLKTYTPGSVVLGLTQENVYLRRRWS